MRFSLFTLFSVSRHIPGPTVCAFHFPCFSVFFFFFFSIFHVLKCVFKIFRDFQFYLQSVGK